MKLSLVISAFFIFASNPLFAADAPKFVIPGSATACVAYGSMMGDPVTVFVEYSCDGSPMQTTTSTLDGVTTMSSVIKQFKDAGLHLTATPSGGYFTYVFSR